MSNRIPRTFLSAAVLAVSISASGVSEAGNDIQLSTNGIAVANASDAPSTDAFADWCDGVCFPTTNQLVRDPANGMPKGEIFVWGKNFQFGAGGSLCFSEFTVFDLPRGRLHVASGDTGTCGAPIDQALEQPLFPELGATVVIAAGGDGVIVEGPDNYSNWIGTYTDRVSLASESRPAESAGSSTTTSSGSVSLPSEARRGEPVMAVKRHIALQSFST